jgi:uncharacterized protein (DUF305 family)
MRKRARTTALAVSGLILTLLVAGCGSSTGDDEETAATARQTALNGDVFNTADVTFASSMIQHHAQAIQMVNLTQKRRLDPQVEELANAVRDAQVPEIETMSDWLTAWGEEVPETSLSHSNAGHDMDDMSGVEGMDDMPGMMSEEDMQSLEDASDAQFQALWLDMMIEHHQGAIEMAQSEQDDGLFKPAVSVAEDIITTQTDEIAAMETLRG